MPIQPLAPTRRLNSRENEPFPSPGTKVPASASWRKNARTSPRNSLASGGNSIGSKRKLKFIGASYAIVTPARRGGLRASARTLRFWISAFAGMTTVVQSSRTLGYEGPELVGAVRGDHAPQALSPHRLVAELLAPCPQSACGMMQ